MKRFCEDLEHVSFVVLVYKYSQLLQVFNPFGEASDSFRQLLIVRVRGMEEFDSPLGKMADCGDEVVGRNGQVLHSCSLEIIQVLLDLGFSFSRSWLVYGKLDGARWVSHYF